VTAYVWFTLADVESAPRSPDKAAVIEASLTPEQKARAAEKITALRSTLR
jgi:hypothetical protein